VVTCFLEHNVCAMERSFVKSACQKCMKRGESRRVIPHIIIIKLVYGYRKTKKTYSYKNRKTNRNKVNGCKQAEQCSETNKNVVQLRMIMYSRHTKLNRQSQIWVVTFHSIEHLPDREDLVTRTERDQIVVEHALHSNYELLLLYGQVHCISWLVF